MIKYLFTLAAVLCVGVAAHACPPGFVSLASAGYGVQADPCAAGFVALPTMSYQSFGVSTFAAPACGVQAFAGLSAVPFRTFGVRAFATPPLGVSAFAEVGGVAAPRARRGLFRHRSVVKSKAVIRN